MCELDNTSRMFWFLSSGYLSLVLWTSMGEGIQEWHSSCWSDLMNPSYCLLFSILGETGNEVGFSANFIWFVLLVVFGIECLEVFDNFCKRMLSNKSQ